ncbi:hypothetical protein FOS14_07020 [Skermania sp. ID1734]|nr:hypothetical protein FOS14_07020 [Skermania sp. ID1734]
MAGVRVTATADTDPVVAARAADDVSVLLLVSLIIAIGSGYTLLAALVHPVGKSSAVTVRRVRQQRGLRSRSWVEIDDGERSRWMPVYFDPVLVTVPSPTPATLVRTGIRPLVRIDGHRLFAAGKLREREPAGTLIDNPARADPQSRERGAQVARLPRRLILDAQFALPAPIIGGLWVYLRGGGVLTFALSCLVAAGVGIWLAAIAGSDPS